MLEIVRRVFGGKFKNRKIIDIWNFRKVPELIESNKYFIDFITKTFMKIPIGKKPVGDKPFSVEDRQYFQCFPISEFQNKEDTYLTLGILKTNQELKYLLILLILKRQTFLYHLTRA